MLKSEFEKLSGIVVSEYLYKIIEPKYLTTDEDKAAFAKRYRDNNDGLATNCCRQEDEQIAKLKESFEKYIKIKTEEIGRLEKQIEELAKQLDKEQEWQPYIYPEEVQQAEYDKNKIAARVLSVPEAIEKVCEEYGFDPAKVMILTLAPAYEKNRHGTVRRIFGATIRRDPLWCATDDNYIRFSCAGYHYEMYNGELRRI